MNTVIKKESLSLEKWIERMKPQYLTIGDINKMRKGDTNKFLCIDRNVYDLASKNDNIPKAPTLFFENNYIVNYTHDTDLKGHVKFECLASKEKYKLFEFHIEYINKHWYPLKDGMLPNHDAQNIFHHVPTLNNENLIRNWKDYPITTHIGWRGPMIPWNCLEKAPMVYYK